MAFVVLFDFPERAQVPLWRDDDNRPTPKTVSVLARQRQVHCLLFLPLAYVPDWQMTYCPYVIPPVHAVQLVACPTPSLPVEKVETVGKRKIILARSPPTHIYRSFVLDLSVAKCYADLCKLAS